MTIGGGSDSPMAEMCGANGAGVVAITAATATRNERCVASTLGRVEGRGVGDAAAAAEPT